MMAEMVRAMVEGVRRIPPVTALLLLSMIFSRLLSSHSNPTSSPHRWTFNPASKWVITPPAYQSIIKMNPWIPG